MTAIIVGISDCKTSTDRDSTLVTYALGSCVGIGVFDPTAAVGGLLLFWRKKKSGGDDTA